MTMERLLYFVKFITIVQLELMVIALFVFCLLRIFFKIKDRLKNKKIDKITTLLNLLLTKDLEISAMLITFFKHNVRDLLDCMLQLDIKLEQLPRWAIISQQLADNILKPQARRLATSHRWLKKHLAVLCFEYGVDIDDDKILSHLVRNETLIVSLNAAKVIFKYPTSTSLNALIDSLAQGRRIRESFFVETLTTETTDAKDIVVAVFHRRLSSEKDPYIKAFCYRILTPLALSGDVRKLIKMDILSDNIELKIAAIQCLSEVQNKDNLDILTVLLNDEHFEVRAVVARLFGDFHDKAVIPLLETKLGDPEWWVRINAAHALSKLGENGILALQKQSPNMDKFAYETAQRILITLKYHSAGERGLNC